MCRGRVALVVLFLAFLLSVTPPSFGQEKGEKPNPARELAEYLKGKGYSRVPLITGDNNMTLVEVPIDGKTFTLLLDTGASNTILTTEAVKAKKLKTEPAGVQLTSVAGINQTETKLNGVLVSGLALGNVKADTLLMFLTEKPFALSNPTDDKPKTCDGVLGADVLELFSGVIDYGDRSLYVIDPLEREKGLQGKWRAMSAELGGVADAADGVYSTATLSVEKDRAKLTLGDTTWDMKLTLGSASLKLKRMGLKGDDGKTGFSFIYKLDGDELVVCGQFYGEKALGLPTEIKSTKDNGFGVIKFRREKPEKK
ncbi:MAG: aspartyl protease family protein [Fimbriiglobus sp.]|nr:aspartyl protease family protein [Fimbriiglobus sp.]